MSMQLMGHSHYMWISAQTPACPLWSYSLKAMITVTLAAHQRMSATLHMHKLLLSLCASSMSRHNWSAMQQHHHLQSADWTSHQPTLSADRNRRCETLFVVLHRYTGQSRLVTISFGRHRNDPAQCWSDSGETTVVEGGQNLVVGLWGQPLSGSWPQRPNSSLSSTKCTSKACLDLCWVFHATLHSSGVIGDTAECCTELHISMDMHISTCAHCTQCLLLFSWHAPLGVCSAICRHQPPQRAVLGQVNCLVQCEVVGSQIALDGIQPRDTRTPWLSLPLLWWGAIRIILAYASSSIGAIYPNMERCCDWIVAVKLGCLVILLTFVSVPHTTHTSNAAKCHNHLTTWFKLFQAKTNLHTELQWKVLDSQKVKHSPATISIRGSKF